MASSQRVIRLGNSFLRSTLAASILRAGNLTPLSQFVERIEAGRSFGSAARPAQADEWGIIKVSAMTWGTFNAAENKVVAEPDRVDPRFEIRRGDLLVSRANTTAYVGASVLVRDTRSKLLLSDKSLRLVPKGNVDPAYLHAVLQAPQTRAQISARATGTKESMRNISQRALLAVEVPRAEPSEQSTLVLRIAAAQEQRERLARAADAGLRRALALRQSLLQAAFSGGL